MAVNQGEFDAAQAFYTDLDVIARNGNGDVTFIGATIRGINGSRTNSTRRPRWVVYRMLADVSDLSSGLPEGWIVRPTPEEVEHVNIWPPDIVCPVTQTRLPRICWGDGFEIWSRKLDAERTLSSFIEVARQVLTGANLESAAR